MIEFFLRKNIKSALKKQERNPKVFLNFRHIKRILVVFDYDNWFAVKPIVDDLIQNNKEVLLWTVGRLDTLNTYIKQDSTAYNIRIVDTKIDVRWNHTLQSKVEDEYNALEYDTFLDLSFEDNQLILYLKATNQSKFSIGLQQVPFKLYNFILLKEEDKDLIETYEQIKFYLSSNT